VIVVVDDHPRREAVAEEVSMAVVAFVETGRVAPVHKVHAVRELLPRRLDEEVVVRAHEAEGEDVPAVALDCGEEQQVHRTVVVDVAEEKGVGDGAAVRVVEAVGKLRTRAASHLRRAYAPRSAAAVCVDESSRFRCTRHAPHRHASSGRVLGLSLDTSLPATARGCPWTWLATAPPGG
jgi:hypothetical protein